MRSKLFILAMAAMALLAPQWASARTEYRAADWERENAAALNQITTSDVGTVVQFRAMPTGYNFTTNPDVRQFYDCAVYFNRKTGEVIFVDDKDRTDYQLIYTRATNVGIGPNEYELFIQCDRSYTESYDLLYNVRTNQARKLSSVDMTILGRFSTMTPDIYYNQPKNQKTQLLHDYFVHLAEGDYKGALSERSEIARQANQDAGINSDQLMWQTQGIFNAFPLVELAEAMLLSYPEDYKNADKMPDGRDLYRAYKFVTDVYKRDTLIEQANAFLQVGDIRLRCEKIKKTIENSLLEDTRKQGTVEAYDKLIMTLYRSELLGTAMAEQEVLAYAATQNANNIAAYRKYLNKFRDTNPGHANDIEQKLFALAYQKLQPTVAACKEYRRDYSMSPYIQQVIEREGEYAFRELENTVEACQEYNLHYQTSHNDEVWHRQAQLDYDRCKTGEDYERFFNNGYYNFATDLRKAANDSMYSKYFEKACELNTVEAYQEYIDHFAADKNAKNVNDAQSRIDKIRNPEPEVVEVEHPHTQTPPRRPPTTHSGSDKKKPDHVKKVDKKKEEKKKEEKNTSERVGGMLHHGGKKK
ncbi:MAG: hypothetical protein IKQ89_06930 [Muribaculaceae bacterium]|nr:hypothetical protein [Muribaculaceae bacterium]